MLPFAIDQALRDEMIDHVTRGNLNGAKRLFGTTLEVAEKIPTLMTIYNFIPAVYFHFDRIKAWSRLYHRLDMILKTAHQGDLQQIYSLKVAIKLCLRDYRGFIADYTSFQDLADLQMFENIAARVTSGCFPDFSDRKVFCIGLSRTGTTSLHKATQILGLKSAHFANPITCMPLAEDDFYLFDAFSDTPVCVCFERLYYQFPNSLFILSTRDRQSWVESMARLSRFHRGTDDFKQLKKSFTFSSTGFLPQYDFFDHELYYQYETLEQALEIYNKRVNSFFTAERESRLLRIDVSAEDKWDRLCGFLSAARPTIPFPHSNSISAFPSE